MCIAHNLKKLAVSGSFFRPAATAAFRAVQTVLLRSLPFFQCLQKALRANPSRRATAYRPAYHYVCHN
jgi:hypothetical protein